MHRGGCRKFNFRSTTTRDWQQLCQQQQQPLKPQAKVQTPLAQALYVSSSSPPTLLATSSFCLAASLSVNSVSILVLVLIAVTWQATSERMQIHAGATPCSPHYLLFLLFLLFTPLLHSLSSSVTSWFSPLRPFSRLMIQLQRRQPSQKLTHCLHRLPSFSCLSPFPLSPPPLSVSLHPSPAFSTVFPSLRCAVICDFYKVFAALACVSCCAFFGLCQRRHVTFARHLTDTCRLPKPPPHSLAPTLSPLSFILPLALTL